MFTVLRTLTAGTIHLWGEDCRPGVGTECCISGFPVCSRITEVRAKTSVSHRNRVHTRPSLGGPSPNFLAQANFLLLHPKVIRNLGLEENDLVDGPVVLCPAKGLALTARRHLAVPTAEVRLLGVEAGTNTPLKAALAGHGLGPPLEVGGPCLGVPPGM